MQRCADLITGWLLAPGAVFGMRWAIGEPTPGRGFRSGPSIVNGVLTEDTGGGICQVSTVLFNTALVAGLEILEKHNHSTDIWGDKRLIELGRDAAFAYAVKDLKFRNSHSAPVVIRLEVSADSSALIGRALSPTAIDGTIEVQSEVIEQLAPNPAAGQPGATPVAGWIVRTERALVSGSRRVTTFDRVDHYRPTFTSPG